MDVIIDAEFDSLTPTRLWCVVAKEIGTGKVHVFRVDVCGEAFVQQLREFFSRVSRFIGHNFLIFDTPALNRLLDSNISTDSVTDTLVLSRLIHAARPGGHSIETIGKKYGLKKKPIIEYDRPELIDEYVERCISDVEINYQFYIKELKRFVDDPEWQDAIKLEHDLALICQDIHNNGFKFDVDGAETLLSDITNRLNKLSNEIKDSVGPITEVDKVVTLRRKQDGTPDARTNTYIDSGLVSPDFADSDTLTVFKTRDFNPGSPKDRIKLLNESGWKPTEKTKTHRDAERFYQRKGFKNLTEADKERWERLKETGWVVNETNLKTLPDDAPTGAKKLAEWLTLEGRRADLEEWLGQYNTDTGRIHSNVVHIGSWTHRCAHRNPNCANIFSAFHGKVNGPVDAIKEKYDGHLRALWCADNYLVGTDAEGIQLRVLAHLMGDEEYIEAVANGRKEDETDVHNVNKQALGLGHLIRDDAKTFIYAWLLGAGTAKVAQILHCSLSQAKKAVDSFVTRYPGLEELKRVRIPAEARRGFFVGLDGRKVLCDSEHLMLAGHLQNGEKILMARANVLWRKELKSQGIYFRQVNFVHDEWQTEARTYEEAVQVGKVQAWSIEQAGKDLGVLCPMKGEYKIGTNWLETH